MCPRRHYPVIASTGTLGIPCCRTPSDPLHCGSAAQGRVQSVRDCRWCRGAGCCSVRCDRVRSRAARCQSRWLSWCQCRCGDRLKRCGSSLRRRECEQSLSQPVPLTLQGDCIGLVRAQSGGLRGLQSGALLGLVAPEFGFPGATRFCQLNLRSLPLHLELSLILT